jgi:hypothetical protein
LAKKSIYTSNELPDGALEEFEHVTYLFLLFINDLQKTYSLVSINAGMCRAMLDVLSTVDKGKVKNALLNQAEYFKQAASKVEE